MGWRSGSRRSRSWRSVAGFPGAVLEVQEPEVLELEVPKLNVWELEVKEKKKEWLVADM